MQAEALAYLQDQGRVEVSSSSSGDSIAGQQTAVSGAGAARCASGHVALRMLNHNDFCLCGCSLYVRCVAANSTEPAAFTAAAHLSCLSVMSQ
jgi:hypothetical protein